MIAQRSGKVYPRPKGLKKKWNKQPNKENQEANPLGIKFRNE